MLIDILSTTLPQKLLAGNSLNLKYDRRVTLQD